MDTCEVSPDSSDAAETRLLALPCLVLELLVHVAEVAAAEDDHGAGGHGWVQAPLHAHLGLQDGGQQAYLTGSPGRPWPGRFGCEGGGLFAHLPPTLW